MDGILRVYLHNVLSENIIIGLETVGQFYHGKNIEPDAVRIHYRFPYFGKEYEFFRVNMMFCCSCPPYNLLNILISTPLW